MMLGIGLRIGGTLPSPAVPATAAPVNTSAPTINGTSQEGQTLGATNGGWTQSPVSYTYQWRRGGTAIPGATGQSYVIVAADVGTTLTVSVTATNAFGSATATSAATAVVAPSPAPAPSPTPVPPPPAPVVHKLLTPTVQPSRPEDATSAAFQTTLPADNALPETGYLGFGLKLERATNAAFTTGYATATNLIETPTMNSGDVDYELLNGLTEGATYYFRFTIVPPSDSTVYSASDPSTAQQFTVPMQSVANGFDPASSAYTLTNANKTATRITDGQGVARGAGAATGAGTIYAEFTFTGIGSGNNGVGIGPTSTAGGWDSGAADRFMAVGVGGGPYFKDGNYVGGSGFRINEGDVVGVLYDQVAKTVIAVSPNGDTPAVAFDKSVAIYPQAIATIAGAQIVANLTGPFVNRPGASPWNA